MVEVKVAIGLQAISLFRNGRRDHMNACVRQASPKRIRVLRRGQAFNEGADRQETRVRVTLREDIEAILRSEGRPEIIRSKRRCADAETRVCSQQSVKGIGLMGAVKGARAEVDDAHLDVFTVIVEPFQRGGGQSEGRI